MNWISCKEKLPEFYENVIVCAIPIHDSPYEIEPHILIAYAYSERSDDGIPSIIEWNTHVLTDYLTEEEGNKICPENDIELSSLKLRVTHWFPLPPSPFKMKNQ